jgi:hypothetical protein
MPRFHSSWSLLGHSSSSLSSSSSSSLPLASDSVREVIRPAWALDASSGLLSVPLGIYNSTNLVYTYSVTKYKT